MRRLHITAEGQTEEAFVNRTLKFHLAKFEVYADVRCVLTSKIAIRVHRGGMTNPELIDQGTETAPSKRIIKVYPDYSNNKPAIGSMIAHEIGVDDLKKTCRHFREWVERLESL